MVLFMWLEIMINLFQTWVILDSSFTEVRQNDRCIWCFLEGRNFLPVQSIQEQDGYDNGMFLSENTVSSECLMLYSACFMWGS